MLRAVLGWIDRRVGASPAAERVLAKVFPDHWSFLLGEIALYTFVVLVATGVFLTFFFVPSSEEVVYRGAYTPFRGLVVSKAYASTLDISFGVRAGLLVRQMHHWAALAFLAVLTLHAARVFFTGAFRRPREINWLIGLTTLILALANGFTGYSLPDDLLGGTGLRIGYAFALSIPVIGTWVAYLFFGGEFPADEMIPRLFVSHVLIIPALIAVLLAAHLALVWRQTHTQFPGRWRREDNVVGRYLWPTYATKSLALLCAVVATLAALGGLVQVNPIWLYGPFEPTAVTIPAQPLWFLGWVEGALRLLPATQVVLFDHEIPQPFFAGVALPAAVFATLYLWPFLEARVTGDRAAHHLASRPRDHPVRTAFGVTGLTFLGLLFFAASNDIQADILNVSIVPVTNAYRVLVFVLPPGLGALAWKLSRDRARYQRDHAPADGRPQPVAEDGRTRHAERVDVGPGAQGAAGRRRAPRVAISLLALLAAGLAGYVRGRRARRGRRVVRF